MNASPIFSDPRVHVRDQRVFCGCAAVDVDWQRLYGEHSGPAPYLLTLNMRGHSIDPVGYYPQNRAVVNDFGSLVTVGAWR